MSITLIDGATGAGKSWFTTHLAYKEWRRNARIAINYPVKFGKNNEDITRWHELEETYHMNNCVLVIDDAIKLLNKQRWYLLPVSFVEKIAGHRHDHIDIITNIQDYTDIDSHIRKNVHTRYRCHSLFRFPNNDRIKPFLQLIYVVKKVRDLNNDGDTIKWRRAAWAGQFFFISRYWTRERYGTYTNIYLDRYICKLTYDYRKPKKEGAWLGKIYSRDMVNQGKAKI